MSVVGATGGICGDDVRDRMAAAIKQKFSRVNRLPLPIDWRSDTGSCHVARDIGLLPNTIPFDSQRSNGMAEAFVRTCKRDIVRVVAAPMHRPSAGHCPAGSPTPTR